MNESAKIKIRFNSQVAGDSIHPDELTLIESMLPELIRELIQDDDSGDE